MVAKVFEPSKFYCRSICSLDKTVFNIFADLNFVVCFFLHLALETNLALTENFKAKKANHKIYICKMAVSIGLIPDE